MYNILLKSLLCVLLLDRIETTINHDILSKHHIPFFLFTSHVHLLRSFFNSSSAFVFPFGFVCVDNVNAWFLAMVTNVNRSDDDTCLGIQNISWPQPRAYDT